MKQVIRTYTTDSSHWVGDGFPVRSLFSYNDDAKALSPFLLLDYAGPHVFTPTTKRRGVGQHPHRGFETVTIAYEGEVEHRDSYGNGGVIGSGDVQWMTAGAGILHEEFHSTAYARKGGPFRMVQLWVNLPAKDKMSQPKYQSLVKGDIPVVELPNGAGTARIIAGSIGDVRGPAETFTPVNVWDVELRDGIKSELQVPDGHTAIVVVLRGNVSINGEKATGAGNAVRLGTNGDRVEVASDGESHVLFLSGQPIDEPIASYGPFVMNTEVELMKAMLDFNTGGFGRIEH